MISLLIIYLIQLKEGGKKNLLLFLYLICPSNIKNKRYRSNHYLPFLKMKGLEKHNDAVSTGTASMKKPDSETSTITSPLEYEEC